VETAPTTQKSNGCGSTKSACDGLLVFANQAHYDATYACLEERLNNYLDGFEAENSGLNDEEFNDLADNVGFGDEQPLIDFETTHGINSYRRKMQELEDLWLLGGANPASNPEQYNMIDDEVDETLFNEHGLVVIGSFVIYIDPSGQEWRIPFTTCAALDEMLATGIPSEYKVLYEGDGVKCNNNKSAYGFETYEDGDRSIVWKVRWRNSGINTKAKAKMKMYRLKSGGWRKHRTHISAKSWGEYDDVNCKLQADYGVMNPIPGGAAAICAAAHAQGDEKLGSELHL